MSNHVTDNNLHDDNTDGSSRTLQYKPLVIGKTRTGPISTWVVHFKFSARALTLKLPEPCNDCMYDGGTHQHNEWKTS